MALTNPTSLEEPQERAGSLKPVIDVLPESVYDNPTWKGLSYFARDAVIYIGLLVALTYVTNVFYVLLIEMLMALVVSALFIVGHDSAHGALFKSRKMNSLIGHLSMLPSFHVYEGWILGHNRIHHPFTVRQGFDFVWHPSTPEQYVEMNWMNRFIHRVEWSWFGSGFYYMHQVWATKMIVGKPPKRWTKPVRRDRWIVAGFVIGMTALFSLIGVAQGHSLAGIIWLDVRTVLLPFFFFTFVIGAAVHVHHIAPDIRWWKKSEWTKFKAQMEGTTVLRIPKGWNFFFHWIMIHVPHHVDMRIPMYHLEEATAKIEEAFPGTVIDKKLRLRDYFSNARACKLYDFDDARWMTYREAKQLSNLAAASR